MFLIAFSTPAPGWKHLIKSTTTGTRSMPTYDYRCDSCGTTYDIFHKVREVTEDVVCPSCGSLKHTRLISAATVSMKGRSSNPLPPCETGGCCDGSCSLN